MESLRDWLERMLIPIGEKDLVAVREQQSARLQHRPNYLLLSFMPTSPQLTAALS